MYFRDIREELHSFNKDLDFLREEKQFLKKEKLVGSKDYVYLFCDTLLFGEEIEISKDVFEALVNEGLVYKIED